MDSSVQRSVRHVQSPFLTSEESIVLGEKGHLITSMFADNPDPLCQASAPAWSFTARFKNTASKSSSRIKRLSRATYRNMNIGSQDSYNLPGR